MGLAHPSARLVDARSGARLVGPELARRVEATAASIAALPDGVVFLRFPLDVDSIVGFLGAWSARRAVALVDPDLDPALLNASVDRYEPVAVLGADPDREAPATHRPGDDPLLGCHWRRQAEATVVPHRDLAILLATSGSTGDPKLVRLSRTGVMANTDAIIEVLGVAPDDVAITSLPFHYSYGMSVLTTHLRAGATVVVEPASLIERDFWSTVDRRGVTTLAVVPSQVAMLRRLRFDPARHPTLRVVTQAGGRLAPESAIELHARLAPSGGKLFVMYGQTEAGPRMTTLPPERLPDKPGSVGPALPGGSLSIRTTGGSETTEAEASGEIIYRGPNVMLGYATTAADLARGDVNEGCLETGDLGHLDEDGFLFLEGRARRFAKVFGVRLNLDDIEGMLSSLGSVAAVAGDDTVIVFIVGADQAILDAGRTTLAQRLRLHWSGFDVRSIPELPVLSTGKVDYVRLGQEA
jgi:acyl-CoA synthetase (AMP-forming)/AMP-acid ligase II